MGSSSATPGFSGVLRRLAEGVALRPLDTAEHGPLLDPAASLTSLLELGGTVRLADHLSTRRGQRLDGRNAPTSPLRDALGKRVSDVRDEIDRAFLAPFTGRRAMPGPEVLDRLLVSHDAFANRDEAVLVEVVSVVTAQARERFDHQLGKGRQRIRWIRTDVAAELRALGPRPAMLEVFDAVLGRSIESGYSRLLSDLSAKLDRIFVHRLLEALRALPEDATTTAPLYAQGATMHRFAAELSDLLRLLLENELDALLALVDTAYSLRNQEALV